MQKHIPKYLENPLIDEIVICDENGDDAALIDGAFRSPKLRVYVNDSRLGAFRNKQKVCLLAKNEWVALIDSDNFADRDYFAAFHKLAARGELRLGTIYAPVAARGARTFHAFSGARIGFSAFRKRLAEEAVTPFNTGNYILNRLYMENLDLCGESDWIAACSASDVVYMNYLFLKQFLLWHHQNKLQSFCHFVVVVLNKYEHQVLGLLRTHLIKIK